MRINLLLCLVGISGTFSAQAHALTPTLSFVVSQPPDSAPVCKLEGPAPSTAAQPTLIGVSTSIPKKELSPDYSLTTGETAVTGKMQLDAGSLAGTISLVGTPGAAFSLTLKIIPSAQVAGSAPPAPAPLSVVCAGSIPSEKPSSSAIAEKDEKAQAWWEKNSQYVAQVLKLVRKGVHQEHDAQIVAFLPSGRVAPPLLHAQTEGTLFQVVQIRAPGMPTADLEVASCPGLADFRIRGSEDAALAGTTPEKKPEDTENAVTPAAAKAATTEIGRLARNASVAESDWTSGDMTAVEEALKDPRSGSRDQAIRSLSRLIAVLADNQKKDAAQLVIDYQNKLLKSGGFTYVPIGQIFTCGAGDMRLKMTYGGLEKPTETTVQLRPHYNLAVMVAGGWDWGSTNSFSLDRTGATPKITQDANRYGTALYAGATWMMGGFDYGQRKWFNYFANPFVAVNVKSPLEDLVFGTVLTPTGGIGVALGVSLHKQTALANGYTTGGTFGESGEIPVRKTWTDVKPGLFLGFAMDTNIFQALSKSLSKP